MQRKVWHIIKGASCDICFIKVLKNHSVASSVLNGINISVSETNKAWFSLFQTPRE